MSSKIKVGVSSCLLGNPVRFNSGHKKDRYLTETLSNYFQFVPVCPEVECGLPTPREALRLVGEIENPRLKTTQTDIDYTEHMNNYASQRVRELAEENLCGFIFKSDSPSCGLYRVKVYHYSGKSAVKKGRGLFAAAMAENFALLPFEEEGRLNDAYLRENFIERLFSYKRWKDFLESSPNYKKLVDFHTREKLFIMAHSPSHYSTMGKLVSSGKHLPHEQLLSDYENLYMEALSYFSTVKKNTNVLQRIMGYFKPYITSDEKAELLELIQDYRNCLVPLTVPLTLINHYVRKYEINYLQKQVYLSPHPSELMLRNHV